MCRFRYCSFFIGAALFSYYETQPSLLDEVRQTVATQDSVDVTTLRAADIGDRGTAPFHRNKTATRPCGFADRCHFCCGHEQH